MSLAEKIEAIRQKPLHVRRWYFYISVAIGTFLALLLWAASLYQSLHTLGDTLPQQQRQGQEKQSSSPSSHEKPETLEENP